MKFFSLFTRVFDERRFAPELDAGWARLRDPMAHPTVQAMSPRELSDLPFNGRRKRG